MSPINSLPKTTFGKQLQAEFLSHGTVLFYTGMHNIIDPFFETADYPSEELIKAFVKKYPRPYHFSALFYYCKYRYGVEIKKPKGCKLPPKKIRKKPSYEELSEAYERIRDKLDIQENVAILLRSYTGRRISEVLMLKVSDIDFENNFITFKMKGGEFSQTPMNEEIKGLLSGYIKERELFGGDCLFYARRINPNTKLPRKARYVQFRQRLEKVDSNFTAMFLKTHDMRGAVISKIVEQKGVATANAWVGHKRLETTMAYVNELSKERLRKEAMEVMS